MRRLTETEWSVLIKTLRIVGFVGCLFSASALGCLILYYSFTRPHTPQPELGWTVPLHWTLWPRAYGTPHENDAIFLVFQLFFPFFALALVAWAIETYKAERVLYILVGLLIVAAFLIIALSRLLR